MTRFKLHANSVAFASLTFGANAMNFLFNLYYVRIFLGHYHLSQRWFYFAEIIYLFWNAINDPLFAYWQDNAKSPILRSRRLCVLYGAPFFALSFLTPFFAWGDYTTYPWLAGLHMITALFCYDAMFTFVELAQCAMFAEISNKQEDRLRLTEYSQYASILGASSVLFAEVLCDGLNNMAAFQTFVIAVAFISWVAMRYTGINFRTMYDDIIPIEENKSSGRSSTSTGFAQFMQIAREKDAILVVTTNFLQVFHWTYMVNFLEIFGDELLPDEAISPHMRKALYGSAFIIPQILVLCLSPIVGRKGYYCVITWSFYFTVFCSVVMYMAGKASYMLLAFFILNESSLPMGLAQFFNLGIADIVDADQKRYKRRSPLSSTTFAFNALITKPAQSLAPMLVVAVLNRHFYQEKLDGNITTEQRQELSSAMFTLACGIPFVLGLLQILVWRQYSIRHSHIVKHEHIDI